MQTRTLSRPPDERLIAVRALLSGAIRDRATPAVAIEVGRRAGPAWLESFGRLEYEPDAPACEPDTVFDLASLTKVIATTSIAARAVSDGRITLEEPVRDIVPGWRGADRSTVTIRHLLDHSSGLPAHELFWKRLAKPAEIEEAICHLPLEQPPGESAVYSDVGFMLLGVVLERALGRTLEALFEPIRAQLGHTILFRPPDSMRSLIAPTEFDGWRGRLLLGEVHDENAAFLGGVAAHAGLFGTVRAVGTFARLVLSTVERPTVLGTPEALRQFVTRSAVAGSSRALGWDTMLPTSSCGTRLSAHAIGHTAFTGPSLWIDPALDLYVALVANRVNPSRTNNRWQPLRPRIHDAVVEAFS